MFSVSKYHYVFVRCEVPTCVVGQKSLLIRTIVIVLVRQRDGDAVESDGLRNEKGVE